jgi:hypothetical protein
VLALLTLVIAGATLGRKHRVSAPTESVESVRAEAPAALPVAPAPVVERAPEPSSRAASSPSATATAKGPIKRSATPALALCPPDKVIFGPDGKKRCALAGRRVD